MTRVSEVLSLDVGPQHPATHGTIRLRVTLDGDTIVEAEPIVGYLHRGVEKLFEVRDYRQIIVLANRHDWLSAFSSELGVALAVERMLGIEVPPRAVWLRMLMAELNRVLNHLMFLGSYAFEVEPHGPLVHGFGARETIQSVMEAATGGRMHDMFNRVGGLKEDVPAGWLERVRTAVTQVSAAVDPIERFFRDDPQVLARTTGIGVVREEWVHAYGMSGAPARASGVDFDLRRDDPYLAYAELAADGVLRVPTRTEGDARARFDVLLEQVRVSLDLAVACVDRLHAIGPGPIGVRVPKIVKAPEGSTYCWTENPLGVNGYLLESRGEKTPWRLKLRTASFNNVSALPRVLPGCRLDDLTAMLASLFFVVGDIDK